MHLCYNYKLTPILDIYQMCAFQFSLSSIITPKNFVLVTLFINLPSTLMFTSFSLCLLVNIMQTVLSTFNVDLLTFSHSAIPASSELIFCSIYFMLFPFRNKLESSANNIGMVFLQTLARSFMHIKNNRGPNIDPCRTPHLINRVFDLTPLYATNCFRFSK